MSLSLISSAGQMPVRDWAQLATITPGDTAAHAISSTSLLVQKAEIFAPAGNAGTVGFGPSNTATLGSLAAAARFTIAGQPGSVFDLSKWYIKLSNGADNVIVAYQL